MKATQSPELNVAVDSVDKTGCGKTRTMSDTNSKILKKERGKNIVRALAKNLAEEQRRVAVINAEGPP